MRSGIHIFMNNFIIVDNNLIEDIILFLKNRIIKKPKTDINFLIKISLWGDKCKRLAISIVNKSKNSAYCS